VKNFHIPLPEEAYADLRAEAERAQQPATALAREAIELWLRARKKTARRAAIALYAAEMAGTEFDLDVQLESAAIEQLMAAEMEANEAR
jgi:hypothetical protein